MSSERIAFIRSEYAEFHSLPTTDALRHPYAALWTTIRDLLAEIDRLSPPPTEAAAAILAKLTPRELQVVDAVAKGLSNKSIARALGNTITEATIKVHLKSAYRKFRVHGRTELAILVTSLRSPAPSNGVSVIAEVP